MRKYGSGPTRAEPIGLGHVPVRLPERILESVGDDNRATDELQQIPGCAHNRMTNGVDVSDGAAWKKDAEFQFVIRFFTYGSIDCCLPYGSILGMDALQTFLPGRHTRFRVEAVYPIPFFG